jgi:flavodoxin I
MALTNFKGKVAIVYSSVTGNTEELVRMVASCLQSRSMSTDLFQVEDFLRANMDDYDGLVIGTYTWGNGEIPVEMMPVYQEIERQNVRELATGVVGTGDSFYPSFCGAVDEFRDMLYVQTSLVATLKVELQPQLKDYEKCEKLAELMIEKIQSQNYSTV